MDFQYGVEESIIKICLSNKMIGQEIISTIRPDYFENPVIKFIYLLYKEELIKGYKDEALFVASIDDYVVKNSARKIILENKANKENWEEYCAKLKEQYNKIKVRDLANSILIKCKNNEDVNKIIASASEDVHKIMTDSIEYEVREMSDIYVSMEHEIGTKEGLVNMAGIGLPAITKMTGDFDLGSVIGLAGRPSMGKTALAVEMVKQLSIIPENPERTLFFSLETEKRRFLHRLISNVNDISLSKIKSADLTREEIDTILSNRDKFVNCKIKFADTFATSIDKIVSICNREKYIYPDLRYVFIDHIQLIESDRTGTRNDELASISRQLRLLANKLNIIIIALMQLSRKCEERTDKRPMLSDLRDCLVGESMIHMDDGSKIPISNLVGNYKDKKVACIDNNLKLQSRSIKNVWTTGKKEVFLVETISGRKIKCSDGHKFKTLNGFTKLRDLKEGEYIGTPRILSSGNDTKILNSSKLDLLASGDIFWDKIKKITSIGSMETYDMEVEGLHNFVADGLIVHNSGAVEQDIDVCIFVYRDEYYNNNSNDRNIMELIVRKNRDGKTGTVKVKCDLERGKFFGEDKYII